MTLKELEDHLAKLRQEGATDNTIVNIDIGDISSLQYIHVYDEIIIM